MNPTRFACMRIRSKEKAFVYCKQLLCPLREAASLNAKNKIHVDLGVLCPAPAASESKSSYDTRHSMHKPKGSRVTGDKAKPLQLWDTVRLAVSSRWNN